MYACRHTPIHSSVHIWNYLSRKSHNYHVFRVLLTYNHIISVTKYPNTISILQIVTFFIAKVLTYMHPHYVLYVHLCPCMHTMQTILLLYMVVWWYITLTLTFYDQSIATAAAGAGAGADFWLYFPVTHTLTHTHTNTHTLTHTH